MGVEIHEFELQLRHRWQISSGSAETKRNAFVRISQDGTIGEGEAAFHRGFGESPESVWRDLARAAATLRVDRSADWESLGLTGAARAAVEMAQLDCLAKQAGKDLGTHLGVAGPGGPVRTSFSIGIDEPHMMKEKAAEAREFEVLKVKLGTARDRENFRAVRSATEVPIRVDANGGWESRDEAARMLDWLAERGGVELVEQPLAPNRLEDTAWLHERSALPIVLDEDVRVASDLGALAGICDGVNIKLMKSGGIREAIRAIEAARHAGLKVMLGCMLESSLAIAAALWLAAKVDWVDLDAHLLLANDPYEGLELRAGRLVLPSGPGIGVHRKDR